LRELGWVLLIQVPEKRQEFIMLAPSNLGLLSSIRFKFLKVITIILKAFSLTQLILTRLLPMPNPYLSNNREASNPIYTYTAKTIDMQRILLCSALDVFTLMQHPSELVIN